MAVKALAIKKSRVITSHSFIANIPVAGTGMECT